jgi:hypothetical protein
VHDIVRGTARALTRTANATTSAAGAVGGAAIHGAIGGLQGAVSGIRNGVANGSHSNITDRGASEAEGGRHPWSRGGTQFLLCGPHVNGADDGQGAYCHRAASAVGAGIRQSLGEKCDV